MKVTFIASPRGTEEFGSKIRSIFEYISQIGYKHVDEDVLTMNAESFVTTMQSGREGQVQWYNKKIKSIKEADICIFETSIHSLGVGFLVKEALEAGKPTIVLYYQDNVPYFLSGSKDEKLLVLKYNDETYQEVLQDALDKAREKRDKRFNFFISPKLLEYLETASSAEGVTKSKFIRNLIVGHMRSHKDDGSISD